MNNTKKYLSIHSLKALNTKQFSIVLANVDNTDQKRKLAKKLYPSENWYIEYHDNKINMNVLIN